MLDRAEMLQLKVILQVAILFTATVFVQSTQNTTFHLQLERSVNIITLTCRNDDALQEPAAVFYLNGSQLSPENYPSFSDQESQAGVVTFQINRQLEGKYTCGVGETKSTPISLIGRHNNLIIMYAHTH